MSETNNTHSNARAEEIQKLQEALGQTLEEVQRLREENERLSRQAGRTQSIQVQTDEDIQLKQQLKTMALQNRRLDQQAQTASYRLARVQDQYEALANSKLGRLTINYWAWQKKNQNKNKLSVFFGFLTRWLFNRLPAADTIDLDSSAYQVVRESGSPEKPAVLTAPGSDNARPAMRPEMEHWVDAYMDRIAAIPDSNGSRYYQRLPYRIGLICDEFFYESISAAADFVFISPENWEQTLEQGLDAMLFVSAWRGLHGEWRGMGAVKAMDINPTRRLAIEILDACRRRNIPTIFYSKEDPPNYEVFLEYAGHCDFICTTAQECVPYYSAAFPQKHVQAVSFGINPVAHNPIGFHTGKKEKTVLFSGSWMLKYPDRCRELALIFDGILDAGHRLHIIDRNYPGDPKYHFPEQYFPYSSPALPHDLLQKVHKLFDWAVNINSVKGSETMFANRAFELQANGVLLLSNFSVGVNRMLPTVQMVQDSSEVSAILNSMNDDERYERQIAGIRSVMTGHTCFDRLSQLLEPAGLSAAQPVRRVLVLADRLTDSVRACFDRQTYSERTLMCADSVTAAQLAQFDMVAWFHETAEYGAFYLEDMVNGFKYTACDYITKDAWMKGAVLQPGTEHNYVCRMGSKYRTLFWREAFDPRFLLTVSGEQALPNGYSIDHFHYNAAPAPKAVRKKDYLLSVVVPVFNNGLHLYAKCFASLRRSSMFEDMEIILVDDGSTDGNTLKIQAHLAHTYSNVRTFRFRDGGSGSAARSRNKGLELASGAYVTFLEPGNEAVCDGYKKLYTAAENRFDFVMGNLLQCGVEVRTMEYAQQLSAAHGLVLENGIGSALVEANFLSADIQCALIRRELLQQAPFRQLECAEGSETLLFWQLLHAARKIRFVHTPVYESYTAEAPAIREIVEPSFFQRTLRIQRPKLAWLQEQGLLYEYMHRRYVPYTVNWLFKKLSLVQENALECARLAAEAVSVFRPYARDSHPLIDAFMALHNEGNDAGALACVQEAFPYRHKRPMLTLEELMGNTKPTVAIPVTYKQTDATFVFTNKTAAAGASFAWVILLAEGEYHKVFATKYTHSAEFVYDFSGMEPRDYKIRAFVRNGTEKISCDVAVIRVSNTGSPQLLKNQSSATLVNGEETT